MEPDCVFCQIVARQAPAHIVYEDAATLAFMDRYPMRSGHTLVVPKRHSRDAFDISPEDAASAMRSAVRVARAVKAALGCDGVNIFQSSGSAAGQTVFHYHVHVLPRWRGDGLIKLQRDHSAQYEDIEALSRSIADSVEH